MKVPEVIATVGSSLSSVDKQFYSMIYRCGIRVIRFNLSKFESEKELALRLELINKVHELYPEFSILADLAIPGKKTRLYVPDGSLYCDVKQGDKVVISSNKTDGNCKFIVDANRIGDYLTPNQLVYCSDGECTLVVKSISETRESATLEALDDARIFTKKSISYGHIHDNMDTMVNTLKLISASPIKRIALSFVSNEKEVLEIRKLIDTSKVELISKVEVSEALGNIGSISEYSSIMVARGDLFLNTNMYGLYKTQRDIINSIDRTKCKVYFATGILTSLEARTTPTQAEVIDLYTMLNYCPDSLILNYGVVANNLQRAMRFIQGVCI